MKNVTCRTALGFGMAAWATAHTGTTLAAAVAVVDFRDTLDRAIAGPDVVDPTLRVNSFAPFVADDIAYDSNLYRLPSYLTNLADLHGIGQNPSRSDDVNSVSAGLDAQWFVGNRQTIGLDLRADDNRYFRNSNLDNVSSSDRLTWDWGLGSALSGEVGADYLRTLAGFTNTVTYSRNVIQKSEIFAAARYQVGPRWIVFGGLLDTKYVFTAAETEFNNSSSKAVETGALYSTDADNRIGFDYRYTDARYPNSILLADQSFDPDYREDRARVLVRYSVSAKTLIDASAGYLKRTYPNQAIGGFSGDVWRLSVQWQPAPKTELVFGAWQELDADLTAQTDYFVSKGGSISPVWTISEKLSVSFTVSREYHDYVGSNPLSDNALATAPADLTQARRDTVTDELGSIVYYPRSYITLTFSAGHELRDSNIPQWQYNDLKADASINFRF
jgi:hypothetical protein